MPLPIALAGSGIRDVLSYAADILDRIMDDPPHTHSVAAHLALGYDD